MNGMHEPREQFVAALESRLAARARFRPRQSSLPAWLPQSRSVLAAAAAIVIVVSMGIGGAAVSFAYQAQTAESRQMLTATYEQRLKLAKARQDTAQKVLTDTQMRVNVGATDRLDLVDAEQKLAVARADVDSVQLQIEEIRGTGLEPANQISAPLVSGRDFVTLRLRIDEKLAARAADVELQHLEQLQQRVAVGVAEAFEVEVSRTRLKELRCGLDVVSRKLDIRQEFLNRRIDAALADLRVLEAEAEQRVKIFMSKAELAKKETARITARVQVGNAQQVEAAEASMRQLQVEYELSKAKYELSLIQRQIAQRGR